MTIRPYRGISLIRVVALISLTQVVAGCSGDSQPNSNGSTDTIPDAFTFAPMTNVVPLLIYASAPVTLTGLSSDAAASAAIDGEGCRLQVNDGDASTEPRTVHNGDVIRLHATAASDFELETSCAVNIGGVIGTFAVTTGANAFAANVEPGRIHLAWGAFHGVTKFQIRGKLGGHESSQDVILVDNIPSDTTSYVFDISAPDVDWVSDNISLWANNKLSVQHVPDHQLGLTQVLSAQAIHFIKAFNNTPDEELPGEVFVRGDEFGASMALSGDTLVVGAPNEDSGLDGEEGAASDSGAVYVFRRHNGAWQQEANLKAPNAEAGDRFGYAVDIDGDVLVVGADGEDSGTDSHVDGEMNDNSQTDSGAVYVYRRSNGIWRHEAYLKGLDPFDTSNQGFRFGKSVAVDGDVVVGGALYFNERGIVYAFRHVDDVWQRKEFIRAHNEDDGDQFGHSLALDGDTLVVGAQLEDSAYRGAIQGPVAAPDDGAENSGAVYVYNYLEESEVWSQVAYLKASNSERNDLFGYSVAVYGDLIAVGASGEDSGAGGINGSQSHNGEAQSGAVYVFRHHGDFGWDQESYLKASNPGFNDRFGHALALKDNALIIGAWGESSAARGVNGNEGDNETPASGSAYVFGYEQSGWRQRAYLKATNTDLGDVFGRSVAIDNRTSGMHTIAVGAPGEDSATTSINGNQNDDCDTTPSINCAENSGAVYVY